MANQILIILISRVMAESPGLSHGQNLEFVQVRVAITGMTVVSKRTNTHTSFTHHASDHQ